MARQKGAVKGSVNFVNDTAATSKVLIVEPLHLTDAEYVAMLDGGTFSGSVLSDTTTGVKYVELTNGTVDTLIITDVLLGVGDAAEVTFTTTLTALPVLAGSVTVTAGTIEATDDEGALVGTGVASGTIDGTTGEVTITLDAAVASETPVTITYTRGV